MPQIGGMYEGDRSRKQTLVDYGFRLPSALDNRPQTFDEFLQITPQIVFVSATPGRLRAHPLERASSSRSCGPTGIVDPEVDVRETRNQIDDLMNEIRARTEAGERTLVTTLTKKMAEDLTDYLLEYGFKVRYLHSEVDTLERIQIIRELRLGEFDVLVGVNLLREGLDLPEVSLVAILDADKEGFLRGETSLIQTIGRAARNVARHGDHVRRQGDRRDAHARSGRPTAAARSRSPTTRSTASRRRRSRRASPTSPTSCRRSRRCPTGRGRRRRDDEGMSAEEIARTIVELEEEMLAAADDLRFEYAAKLRDEIKALRRELDEAEAESQRLSRLAEIVAPGPQTFERPIRHQWEGAPRDVAPTPRGDRDGRRYAGAPMAEEPPKQSAAATAAEQVRAIVEAAERSAAELEAEARRRRRASAPRPSARPRRG